MRRDALQSESVPERRGVYLSGEYFVTKEIECDTNDTLIDTYIGSKYEIPQRPKFFIGSKVRLRTLLY